MAFSKIIYNGTTLIDLTQDTVTASNLLSSNTAHDAAGVQITGTLPQNGVLVSDTLDSAGGTIRTITPTSAIVLQSKTVTPSSAQQIITPDTGYNALSQVIVNAENGPDWDAFVSKTYPQHIVLSTATLIPDYLFSGTGIQTISGDSVINIGTTGFGAPGRSFLNCTNLTSISFPNAIYAGTYSFDGCSNLTTVNLPKMQTMGRTGADGYCFRGTKITSLYLPELTETIGVGVFRSFGSSSNKVTIVLPKFTTMGGNTFRSSYIAVLDLGPTFTGQISNDSLYQGHCDVLILRSTTLVSAYNTESIAALDANSTVYIPKVLYDHLDDGTEYDYKAATNWSSKTTITWAQIEGSQYENYYANGVEIPVQQGGGS